MSAARIFITTDAVGGVWRYSVALARGLVATGHDVTLAILGAPADAAQRNALEKLPGCRLLQTNLPLDWRLTSRTELDAVIATLKSLVRDADTASVHLHTPALAANGWWIPAISVGHSCVASWWKTVHGGDLPADLAWQKRAMLDGMTASNAIVAPSHAFAHLLTNVYGAQPAPRVIYNGLPGCQPAEMPRDDIVLCAGRLWDHAKNIAILDAAAEILPLAIHAAGSCDSPDGSTVRFSRLTTLGSLSEAALHNAMSRAAIFASPALYEPFGLSVLEAAQRGMPLVLSDIQTFRELWNGAALFLPANDAAAWAACLHTLLADTAQRHRLGQAARSRSLRYTQQTMVAATIALHDQLRPARMHAA